MDRQIIYPGQVPLETDLLKTNQNVMVGLAKLSEALFGTSPTAVGFGTTQTVVPSLAVLVAPGEIYALQNLEASAISSLPQDLARSIVKQGISLDTLTLPLSAPATPGFSVNYLLQVGYQDTDSGSAVLPYYNASNPSVAYSGPANSGAAQPTIRQGSAVVSLKAGTAATTGSQTTPSPDAGKVGLYVVTVANGASTVVNANISPYVGAPLAATPLMAGRLLNVRTVTSSGIYTPTQGTRAVRVTVQGAGGGGGASLATGASQVATGAGGNSGASAQAWLTSGFAGAAMVVGTGGAGGNGGGGANGGGSSFGTVSAPGGSGGPAGAAMVPPGMVPPSVNSAMALGANIFNASTGTAQPGFAVSASSSFSGTGASSIFGQGPAGRNVGGGGGTATNYGCGGAGALSGASAGANPGGLGGPGVIIVEEFA